MHVAVVYGGVSAEREVSLSSGREVAKGLEQAGYDVTMIDAADELIDQLRRAAPDVVFNALHGKLGEDGTIQGLLDLMDIPYTHSGVLASSMAMHKGVAMTLFRSVGLQCPEGQETTIDVARQGHFMDPPYVIKPVAEGSSVGVIIVQRGDNDLVEKLQRWPHDDRVLVERYIEGRELTVSVLGDRALCVTEIKPNTAFYDYRAKYTDAQAVHTLPADLPPEVTDAACQMAVQAHKVLGCHSLSRADFRYDDRGDPSGLYLLEVNTQPGMTPLSLVPEQADYAGISFSQLVKYLVEEAACQK